MSTATLLLLLLLLLLPVLLLLYYYYYVRPTTCGPGTHMVLEPRFRLAPVPRVHIAQLLQIGCPHGPYLIPVHVVLARTCVFACFCFCHACSTIRGSSVGVSLFVVSFASFSKTSSCGYIIV